MAEKKISALTEKTATLVNDDETILQDSEVAASLRTKRTKISNISAKVQADFMASSYKSTDGTLADNSDAVVPTEKAVKTYVDNKADLVGTYFSIVDASGTPVENGASLLAEYARVKALVTSGELTLDADTRYTLYIPAGQYDLTADLVVDTDYLDVRSLNGECSVYFTTNSIDVTAVYVNVTGIDVGTQVFKIADSVEDTIITNCRGMGAFSFSSYGGETGGVFMNCMGGDYSFGANGGDASGTFENCIGGLGSFGGNGGIANGTFTNCVSGDYSFGGDGGDASGTFENCIGGIGSFGGGNIASGTFINCTGGGSSFGGYNGTASGTFINCIAGSSSYGGDKGTASGTFNNCVGGDESFGGYGGTANGTFTNCVSGDYSFGGYSGTASGTFNNCVGGDGSFGTGGTASGKFYWCRLTSGSFPTPSGSGQQRMCLNADGTEVNADAPE